MPSLSENQAAQVRDQIEAQIRPIVRRMTIWLAVFVVCLAGSCFIAVYSYVQSQHAIQHRALALSRDNCLRSQQGRRALALIVHTAIPPHAKHRTADEQAFVDQFYMKVAPALRVPTCT